MKIVTIFIQNNNKEFLIQKRSKEKNGKYGITSGHVEENEEMKQAAIREIKEELGLDIKENELKLFYSDKVNEDSYNLYILKKDFHINNLTLQKEEVEFVKWCNINEIEKIIEEGNFFKTQIEAYNIAKKMIKI